MTVAERWHAGPKVEANGATIIPIEYLTFSDAGQGCYGTISPVAVVVLFGGGAFIWNIDVPAKSLESWLREVPELFRSLEESMEPAKR